MFRLALWFLLFLFLPLLCDGDGVPAVRVERRLLLPFLPDLRRLLPSPLLLAPPPLPPYTLTILSADGPGGRLDRCNAAAAFDARCTADDVLPLAEPMDGEKASAPR